MKAFWPLFYAAMTIGNYTMIVLFILGSITSGQPTSRLVLWFLVAGACFGLLTMQSMEVRRPRE